MMRSVALSVLLLMMTIAVEAQKAKEKFVCEPCGNECDLESFDSSGVCPVCQMRLVPASTVTFKSISYQEVCDRVKKNPDIILLDVRSPGEFNGSDTTRDTYGKLRNAINLDVRELSKRYAELEQYRNRDIIVYCSHSHRSPSASYFLSTHGFKKITNMSGGVSTLGAAEANQPDALFVPYKK